jgi:hypothetical protein
LLVSSKSVGCANDAFLSLSSESTSDNGDEIVRFKLAEIIDEFVCEECKNKPKLTFAIVHVE